MTQPERFRVPDDLDMMRSDRIVAKTMSLSRAAVGRLVAAGAVTVDGNPVRAAQPLPAGTEVVVAAVADSPAIEPAAVDFAVVHEDTDLLVVAKPAGVVVHPGAGPTGATLAAGLIRRFPDLADMEEQRWGLVHRLDKDTSGVLLVARTPAAHAALQSQLRRREIARSYLALVAGDPAAATGTIDAPLGRDPNVPTRRALRHDGKPARTHYRRLASWGDVALLEVHLETGRTHQIRVHLASIDHPVVGDRVYGSRGRCRGDPGRQWLHAYRLVFTHPHTGVATTAESGLTPDLVATLADLGPPASGSLPTGALPAPTED